MNQQDIREYSIDAYSFQSQTYADELKAEFEDLGEQEPYSVLIENCQSNQESLKLFETVFDSPSQNLVKFQISESQITQNELQFFTKFSWPHLRILNLYSTQLDQECAELLSKCIFPSLNTLGLHYCNNGDAIISIICHEKLSKLKELSLCRNQLTSNGLKNIGRMKQWKELQVLELDENNFESPIDQIGELFDFPKLKTLNFRESNLNEEIISKIDKQKTPLLERLEINDCLISGKDLFNLDKNVGWIGLKQLEMGAKNISQQQISLGFSNVCQYPLPNLSKLSLKSIHISKESFKHFSKAQWHNLKSFTLCNIVPMAVSRSLQPECIKILSKLKWDKLESLFLSNEMMVDSFAHLMCSSNWPLLTSFALSLQKITSLMFLWMVKSVIPLAGQGVRTSEQTPKIIVKLLQK